jgi:hypothetical protein
MKLKLRIKTALKCNKTLITTQIAFLAAATAIAHRNGSLSMRKKIKNIFLRDDLVPGTFPFFKKFELARHLGFGHDAASSSSRVADRH